MRPALLCRRRTGAGEEQVPPCRISLTREGILMARHLQDLNDGAGPASALAAAHRLDETLEQVETVLRSGACLRMILHREDRTILHRDAAVGAVEERYMRLLDADGKGLAVDGEAVVHRGDVHPPRGEFLHRMVRAMMAMAHLDRPGAEGEGEDLVAEADAEYRDVPLEHAADRRHRIGSGRRRIARPVREEDALGLMGKDFLRRGG